MAYVYLGLVHINIAPHFLTRLPRKLPIPMAARSKGVGRRPLSCWDCGFESRRGHERISLVSVVYCQVEFSESG
jgi:hypothetical protein